MADVGDARAAAEGFDLPGPVDSVEVHASGHINDAFLVTAGGRRYLLQRLNPHVFPDPAAVMANVVAVTDHLRSKGEPTLTLVAPTATEVDSAVWRMYDYVGGMHPAEVRSSEDAAVVGRAFGRFDRLLADLDPTRLRVSLPHFHDPAHRLRALEEAALHDHDHDHDCDPDVNALLDLRGLVDITKRFRTLPVRAVHNDAKAANLLVDDTGQRAPLVVDLDTVMGGTVLWDIGDMVRSSTGTPDEASRTVRFDLERYRALVDAWLGEVGDILTKEELGTVDAAGPAVTYEQAVRFLTDHLNGDIYFRVDHRGQNLERARNQLQLLRSMMSQLSP